MLRTVCAYFFVIAPLFSLPQFFLTSDNFSPGQASEIFLNDPVEVLKDNRFNGGFTNQTVWIKLSPEDIALDKTILDLGYPLLDYVSLHTFQNGTFTTQQSGDFTDYANWPVDHKNPAFFIANRLDEQRFYLLEISTSSSLQVELNTYSQAEFNIKNRIEQVFSGMYYGAFLIMMIYNFFIWLFVRDKSYLYYILFLIGFSLLAVTFQGYAFQNMWPNSVEWNSNAIIFFILFSLWAALSFQRHLLALEDKLPLLDKVGQYLRGSLLIGAAIAVFTNSYAFILLAFSLLTLTVIHLLCSSFILIKEGDRSAKLYFFAWSFLIVGSVVNMAVAFDWLPPYFVLRNAMQIGSVFEIALLSFTLGDRYQQILIDKERAQEELLETRKRSIDRQQRQLRSFYRFVPRDFIALLKKRRFESIGLGDAKEVSDMTILFADIRGFTDFAERNKPEAVLQQLNNFLREINPIINKHDGFIDKYIGDAIMALFPRNPAKALSAAYEMNDKIAELNRTGSTPFKFGIGLHYGPVILGSIGSEKRIDMTVIGDAVNTASRIETLTRVYDVDILLTRTVLDAAEPALKGTYRSIDMVQAKGKSDKIEIFELLKI